VNHLLRSHAPITTRGWEVLDSEARGRLRTGLAARKLVDFSGPHGFDHSSLNLGRVSAAIESPVEGVEAKVRQVLPLAEIRVPFAVSRSALLDVERGAPEIELEHLDRAARQVALIENVAVLHGWEAAGIIGTTEASVHESVTLGDSYAAYPAVVAHATEVLRIAGIDGPYGLALGPEAYTGVVETSERGGHLLLDHLRTILGGPVVWAPGVRGGVVLSLRGGDFLLVCGEDLSIGYDHHDNDSVSLYLEETFTFQVASPDAVVALTP
jgi:uncharacterized linocin/CFP29 family protein